MFNLEEEKQKLVDFLELRTNQSVEEYTFYDKYGEIQELTEGNHSLHLYYSYFLNYL